MALPDHLQHIQIQALEKLSEVHAYYAETKAAWNFVHRQVRDHEGLEFRVSNIETGDVIVSAQDLAIKARDYTQIQLAETSFQLLISTFEVFFFDLLAIWFCAKPDLLEDRPLNLSMVLAAQDKSEIIQNVVDEAVNKFTYQSPVQWFKKLSKLFDYNCVSDIEIQKFAEAKASRDILVHNQGIVNERYLFKAGENKRFEIGERISVSEAYFEETQNLLKSMIQKIAAKAIEKA